MPVEYWRAGEPTGELTVPWWYYVCLGTTLGWVVLMCAGFFGTPLGRLELAWPVLSMLSFISAVFTVYGPPCPEPAGDPIRPIAELLCRAQDALPSGRSDAQAWVVVEHPGDGRHAHPDAGRDVFERGHPSLAMPSPS